MLVSEDVIYVDRLLLACMSDECKATAALDQKQQQNYWIKKQICMLVAQEKR